MDAREQPHWVKPKVGRKRNGDQGALPIGAVHSNLSVVEGDDPLHNGQPQPGAGTVPRGIRPVKPLKDVGS